MFQHNTTLLEVWSDDAFDHVGVRGIRCDGDCWLYDLKPLEHKVGEQYIVLDWLAFRLKFPPCFHQQLFRFLLVALYGQACGYPLCLSFPRYIRVTQDDIKIAFLLLQVSC